MKDKGEISEGGTRPSFGHVLFLQFLRLLLTSSACASSKGMVSTSCSPIKTFAPRDDPPPPSGFPPPPLVEDAINDADDRATNRRSTEGGREVGSRLMSSFAWESSPRPSASWNTSWIFDAAGENTLKGKEREGRG